MVEDGEVVVGADVVEELVEVGSGGATVVVVVEVVVVVVGVGVVEVVEELHLGHLAIASGEEQNLLKYVVSRWVILDR